MLTGGLGVDTFVFTATSQSRTTTVDRITDFIPGIDDIDLSGIDANTSLLVLGDQAFSFIGASAFTRVAGQLRFDTVFEPGTTHVYGDNNGDGVADFDIRLTGTLTLTANDFIL